MYSFPVRHCSFYSNHSKSRQVGSTKTNSLQRIALGVTQNVGQKLQKIYSTGQIYRLSYKCMSLVAKVVKTIEGHKLLKSGDSVLAALSGGPDSVALLHVLTKLRNKYKLKLYAIYINHQIRTKAALKEDKFCRNLCADWKVEYRCVAQNIPKLSKILRKGIEETARDFRYEQFDVIAQELGCNKIALGHHIDDRVETVLFRILRGTGRTGLQGMPIQRGKYIRPLFDVAKVDILKYLRKNKIRFCVDQSNTKVDYTRNFIRNQILPLVRRKINSNVETAILNLIDNVADEENFLEQIVEQSYKDCVSRTPAGKLVLALNKFNGYDLWVKRRLVRRCIVNISGTKTYPDKVTVDRVLEVINGEKAAAALPNKIRCQKKNGELYIFRVQKQSFSKELNLSGQTSIGTNGYTFKTGILHSRIEIGDRTRQSSKVIVDFDKLSPPLLVRNIATGDKFQPLGLAGTKKVGDYLTDRKVNVLVRDEIPVVTDSKGIIWLAGYEIDERVKIDSNTKRALKIEYASGCQTKADPV